MSTTLEPTYHKKQKPASTDGQISPSAQRRPPKTVRWPIKLRKCIFSCMSKFHPTATWDIPLPNRLHKTLHMSSAIKIGKLSSFRLEWENYYPRSFVFPFKPHVTPQTKGGNGWEKFTIIDFFWQRLDYSGLDFKLCGFFSWFNRLTYGCMVVEIEFRMICGYGFSPRDFVPFNATMHSSPLFEFRNGSISPNYPNARTRYRFLPCPAHMQTTVKCKIKIKIKWIKGYSMCYVDAKISNVVKERTVDHRPYLSLPPPPSAPTKKKTF